MMNGIITVLVTVAWMTAGVGALALFEAWIRAAERKERKRHGVRSEQN